MALFLPNTLGGHLLTLKEHSSQSTDLWTPEPPPHFFNMNRVKCRLPLRFISLREVEHFTSVLHTQIFTKKSVHIMIFGWNHGHQMDVRVNFNHAGIKTIKFFFLSLSKKIEMIHF